MVIHGLAARLPQCDLCGSCAVIVVQDPAGHRCGYCSHHVLVIGPLSSEAACWWAYDVARERADTTAHRAEACRGRREVTGGSSQSAREHKV